MLELGSVPGGCQSPDSDRPSPRLAPVEGRKSEGGLASIAHRRLMSGVRAPCNTFGKNAPPVSLQALTLPATRSATGKMAVRGRKASKSMIQYRHDRVRQPSAAARISQHPPRLVAIVDRALADHGVSATRFGRDAVNDPALVGELRAGRQPRPHTRAAIIAHVERIRAGKAVRHG